MLRRIFLILSVVGLAGCQVRPAPEWPTLSAWRDDSTEAPALESRESDIRHELAAIGNHLWAGEYRYHDGLTDGLTLLLAPESGFLAFKTTCTGHGGACWGTTRQSTHGVELIQADARSSVLLLSVQWAGRRYLVPESQVVEFFRCSSGQPAMRHVNGMKFGGWFLRSEDWHRPGLGVPEVPPGFVIEHCQDSKTATIIGVGRTEEQSDEWPQRRKPSSRRPHAHGGGGLQIDTGPVPPDANHRTARVTLGSGRNSGLYEGLVLQVVNLDQDLGRAVIERVWADGAEASLDQVVLGALEPPSPEIGWQLQSPATWRCRKID
jgi:hypothetical protein